MGTSNKLIKKVILNAHKQVLEIYFKNKNVRFQEIKGSPYYILNFCYDNNNRLKQIEVRVFYKEKPIMFIMPNFIDNFLSDKKNLTKEAEHKLIYWGNHKSATQKKIKKLMILNMHNCCLL